MKTCPQCHAEVADNAAFCTKCGVKMTQETAQQESAQQETTAQSAPQQEASQQNTNYNQQGTAYTNPAGTQYYQQPMIDIYDHTAEFDSKDISDNKVIAMLVYLMGTIGIIIALLASSSSKYAAFHVRQALKFTVVNILLGIVAVVFFWTFIIPIAAGIMAIVLGVIRIICFFQICGGKAKEPYIIRNFNFLR